MMGHRGQKKTGEEWDAFTNWREVVFWQRGELKRVKRRYNKRQRKAAKMQCQGNYCPRLRAGVSARASNEFC